MKVQLIVNKFIHEKKAISNNNKNSNKRINFRFSYQFAQDPNLDQKILARAQNE